MSITATSPNISISGVANAAISASASGAAAISASVAAGAFATVPIAPVLVLAAESNLMTVYFRAPTSDGGSAITGYKFYLDGDETPPPDSIVTQTGGSGASAYDRLANWASIVAAGQILTAVATNAIGDSPSSNGIVVTSA